MTGQPTLDQLAHAWIKATGHDSARAAWRPAGYNPDTGLLGVECRSSAHVDLLRLVEKNFIRRMNAALPEPMVQRVAPRLWTVRVLVTGSRSWGNHKTVADALLDAWHDTTQTISPEARFRVVHGDCPNGADALAKQWALDNGLDHEPHPADWSAPCDASCPPGHRKTSPRHGDYCPLAGHRRNQLMVSKRADLVLAFRRNNSRGTTDCIRRAKRAGIPVLIFEEHRG
ncbi:DUF2493 domain-containing protein (plasmid) [Streptomyces sp. NBC_01723]|uniref:SLOG family protein n=1 Tax=Streptomyces sp. NBC_01723 TaxID=2975921 RepID=UPI002E2F4C1A|nr:SLOG family protein [Streptomyces sp. NBC_01723]